MEEYGIYSGSGKHEIIQCSTCGNYYNGAHYCSGKGPNTPTSLGKDDCINLQFNIDTATYRHIENLNEQLTKAKAELENCKNENKFLLKTLKILRDEVPIVKQILDSFLTPTKEQ